MENMVTVSQEAGIIKCDFESVKKRLNQRLDEYKDAIFTEDSKGFAKKEVASLRKEKKAFADRIREVKTAYMEPYNRFEKQAKELLALYDGPIDLIDGQVKDFDEKRKEEKRELIRRTYEETVEGFEDYITLEEIYNPKWENITFPVKDIRQEIYDTAMSVKLAVEAITSMKSEAQEEALSIYRKSFSLPDAITHINKYEQQKAEILIREQERQRQEEINRIRQEEREKMESERLKDAEFMAAQQAALAEKEAAVEQAKVEAAQEVIESLIPETEGETLQYEYRIILTADAKEKLEMYMDSIGLEWELLAGWDCDLPFV